MTTYLGIDPGLNGGFAVISGNEIKYKIQSLEEKIDQLQLRHPQIKFHKKRK